MKEKIKYYLIIAGIVLVLILDFFSEPLIDYYKAKNEPLRLASIRANKQLKQARDLLVVEMDSILKSNATIQVFTNDFQDLEAMLVPDLDLYVNPYAPSFSNRQSHAEEIERFLKRSDTIGYKVYLKSPRGDYFCSRIYSNYVPGHKDIYKVLFSYKRMVKDIDKYANLDSIRLILSGNEKREYLIESARLSKEELFLGEMEGNLSKIMRPIFDLENPTYLFYFCSYDPTTSEEEFLEMIEAFKGMFLKGYDCTNCAVKTLPLTSFMKAPENN